MGTFGPTLAVGALLTAASLPPGDFVSLSRVALVALALAAGLVIATATYSLADPWFHHLVQ